jgi:hypothetical protein
MVQRITAVEVNSRRVVAVSMQGYFRRVASAGLPQIGTADRRSFPHGLTAIHDGP